MFWVVFFFLILSLSATLQVKNYCVKKLLVSVYLLNSLESFKQYVVFQEM